MIDLLCKLRKTVATICGNICWELFISYVPWRKDIMTVRSHQDLSIQMQLQVLKRILILSHTCKASHWLCHRKTLVTFLFPTSLLLLFKNKFFINSLYEPARYYIYFRIKTHYSSSSHYKTRASSNWLFYNSILVLLLQNKKR
jgi:hypothetical protein